MRFYSKFLWLLGIFIALYFLDIKGSSLYMSDTIKRVVVGAKNSLFDTIQAYFFQAQNIRDFQKERLVLEALKLENADLKERLRAVYTLDNKEPTIIYTLSFMTSFASLENTHSIYLNPIMNLEENKIYGLVSNNKAIGIAMLEKGRLKGYLNAHKQCAYSVMIGEHKVLGFTRANFKQELVVEFIAPSAEIKIGDKVMTSGLDGIFGAGVFVGEVARIEEHYSYKSAILKNAFISSAELLRHVFLSDVKN
ncbi:rod shape-determining protein MreC [Helicobacter cetorum]|uniref:Rod shape-determining protein MreC n=1 Tax=Helicobacter cetorum (strain ATCC BAA-540 / CCUG 52418 / MIT 99-5656) TaxID=1163745 RepID=I0ESQ2_HELCM|nr:rod shape-determining protein MreC [Helicobacter cetorum]AFI05971.1 rod shape-determining protein MreC [Helicobacter cetorum MIT 99-5656]